MKTKYFKLFEKHYNDQMGPDEKSSFEKALSEDPEMNEAYKEYLGIYEALGEQDTIDLRLKLREIRDEEKKNTRKNDFFSQGYNWLWMAALITVMISFTTITSLLINRSAQKEEYAYEVVSPGMHDLNALDRELIRFEQRKMDFSMESPKESLILNKKNPLLFKWSVNSTDPLILELIDWKGQIVFTSRKPVESPYIINAPLPPGIIVYRFRTATEAYYLGFIYLR